MPRFGLAVITDGRTEYLRQCLTSMAMWGRPIGSNRSWPFVFSVIVDDSGDGVAHDTFDSLFDVSIVHPERRGLCAAVNTAWDEAAHAGVDYLLHVEEDFVFTAPIELDAMAFVLDECEYLAQMVLMRQPWSDEEKAAGGIVELRPGLYEPHQLGTARWRETSWLFSLNPSLIRRDVFAQGFDAGAEAGQTARLVEQGYRFGLWGAPDDPPRVEHIGARRSAGWRL